MCGIVGVFHYREQARPVDRGLLERMTRTLAHRGPDGEGLYAADAIGLGHRRLAILDVTESGAQPMRSHDGGVVITYNGEVYNFRQLRAQLEGKGHRFRSTSDTEVLLEAYRAWGDEMLQRIEGIFAFGIWDLRRKRLLLARDPIGVKPLYVSDLNGTLRFASEPKAILRDPAVPRDLDLEGLGAFFAFSFMPGPLTGFAAIRQLEPGQSCVVDDQGPRIRRYHQIEYAAKPRDSSFDTEVERFESLLDEVTKDQMVSDVPVGAFLSGGLDSAAIVRSMKRANLGEVHALTVGFGTAGFDERDAARQTARALGVETAVEEMRLDLDLIPKLSLHVEEPMADSSIVPVWLLCAAARRRFTVAMSGDGADDIIAGYDTYQATLLADHIRRVPRAIRNRILLPLAERLPVADKKYGARRVATRLLRGVDRGPGRDHASWRMIFDEDLQRRLFTPELASAYGDPLGRYAAYIRQVPQSREPLLGLLHADTAFYLPNDMLVKVDRMSMAHGLEVRVPFLDVRMVKFAADLAPEHKLKGLSGRKHILRESLRRSLPASVLGLPKSGFNAPIERWMREDLRDLLLDTAATVRTEMSRLLDVRELERVVEDHRTRRADHAHALFAALMLALWLKNCREAWKNELDQPTPNAVSTRSIADPA